MSAEEFWRGHHGISFDSAKRLMRREYPSIDSPGDIPRGERKSAAFCFGSYNEFHPIELTMGEMIIVEKRGETKPTAVGKKQL